MTSSKQLSPAVMASRFVNSTDRNIFLTGKAGTGKTTFLKKIVEETHKKTVVAAPTGIAAINAGGVTLHSLFHLPFGAFIPQNVLFQSDVFRTQINTPNTLIKSLRMNSAKRRLIREMELLIIDEVSMLRADTLDAIDTILRHIRKRKKQLFGGVQVLFIGDLQQLPPVIKNEEKSFLNAHYHSGYFFEAKALENNPPVYIELEKIYRQTDQQFIRLLNHFRDNKVKQEDIELINQHYQPNYKLNSEDGAIYLTTHNQKADEINQKALKKLPGNSQFYEAEINGDFSENLYPLDYRQEFKEGAQVMFIKNDYSGEGRYFNGKIGVITDLAEDEIEVSFEDGSPPALVERYTWENKRFSLNKETREIQEHIKGTFRHYPIKLAWAVTIHKSQGLTFQKAVIDVSQAFAPGQIYVALSRLVSLDGLILTKPLPDRLLHTEASIQQFSQLKKSPEQLKIEYNEQLPAFIQNYVMRAFDFSELLDYITEHLNSYNKDDKKSAKQKYRKWALDLRNQVLEVKRVGDKFQSQIWHIAEKKEDEWLNKLMNRVVAAKLYFEPLLQDYSESVFNHIDELKGTSGVKKYINELRELEGVIFKHLQSVYKAEALIHTIIQQKEITRKTLDVKNINNKRTNKLHSKRNTQKTQSKAKPGTKEISYDMFMGGRTIDEIATARSLAISTIEGHLASFVESGQLSSERFLDKVKASQIMQVADAINSTRLSEIKAKLGDEYTYSDIRFAMAAYKSKLKKDNKD